MIPFEELLTGVNLRHVSLLSYTASLSHLEHAILPNLRATDEGTIGLLVDRSEYEQCFSEAAAVTGPGVLYSLNPVDLPNPNARFHPKFYVFVEKQAASVVVSSANLTIYGCRNNLEVVDLLELGRSETVDRSAFQDCIAFLNELTHLLSAGSQPVLRQLEATRKALEGLLEETVGSDSRARLLHTVTHSLLEQVVEHVPPDQVHEITVVSPFYDPKGRALIALADRYYQARIRVILASPEDANMDGAVLVGLAHRLEIEKTTLSGASRWLHAKLYVFKGPTRSWILSGSANLSSAAWLRSAASGGNVEAVTLRRVGASAIRALLTQLSTHKFDFAGLTYKPDDRHEPSIADSPPFRLLHAVERDDGVEIMATARPPGVELSSLRVSVQGRGAPIQGTEIEVADGADGLIRFRAAFGSAFQTEEGPLIVTVSDARGRARIWMERPRLLALSVGERALRRTIARLEMGSFGNRGDFAAIVGLISQYASEISLPVSDTRPTMPETGEKTQGVRQPPVSPTPIGHLRVGIDEIPVGPTGRPTSVRGLIQRAIRGFDRFLFVKSTAADEFDYRVSGRFGFSGSGQDAEQVSQTRASALDRDALKQFESEIGRVLDQIAATNVSVALSVKVLELADILSRLTIHMYVHFVESLPDGRSPPSSSPLLQLTFRSLVETLSLRVSDQGVPRGWLVRAWLQDRTSVRDMLLESSRLRSVVSFLAASTILASDLDTDPAGAKSVRDSVVRDSLDCVMGGILLITGAQEPTNLLRERTLATSFAAGVQRLLGERAAEGKIYETLTRLAAAECSTIRTARRWGPFLALRQAEERGISRDQIVPLEARLKAASPKLFESHKRVRSRGVKTLAQAQPDGDAAVCGRCYVRISIAKCQILRSAEEAVTSCDSCGATLIPIDFGSEAMRRIFAEIDPELKRWFES